MSCLTGNKMLVIRNDFLGFHMKRGGIRIIKGAGEYLGFYINVDIKFNDISLRDNL